MTNRAEDRPYGPFWNREFGWIYGPFWNREFGLHYAVNVHGAGADNAAAHERNRTDMTAADFRNAAQVLRCAVEVADFEGLRPLAREEIAKMLDMKAATMDPEWSPS